VSPTLVPFVDAHIHLWDLERLRYPWLSPPFDENGPNGGVELIATNYGIVDYRRDVARWDMRGAVHVEAGADPEDAVAETQWLSGLAETFGLPSAIVAFAQLDDPEVERSLDRHAAHTRVRGVRQIVNWHNNPSLTYAQRDLTLDDQWWAGFELLGKYGLSFDLQCYPRQLVRLAPLIQQHPNIPVIINHMGMPITTESDGIERWRHGLKVLAASPHVSVKISGLGFIHRNWTLEQVRPLILEVIDMFGTSRCLFASDTPTDKLFAPVDAYLETYHALTIKFSEDERRALFGRNANRVYRLGLDV
jgi:predicted TIM-barrel fold metal-dependent hydrolase